MGEYTCKSCGVTTPETHYELICVQNLRRALENKEECIRAWVAANSPKGWIDELRRENEALKSHKSKCDEIRPETGL